MGSLARSMGPDMLSIDSERRMEEERKKSSSGLPVFSLRPRCRPLFSFSSLLYIAISLTILSRSFP